MIKIGEPCLLEKERQAMMLPYYIRGSGACKVISSLAGGMKHLDHFVSVLLRASTATVPLQLSSCENSEARERRGSES